MEWMGRAPISSDEGPTPISDFPDFFLVWKWCILFCHLSLKREGNAPNDLFRQLKENNDMDFYKIHKKLFYKNKNKGRIQRISIRKINLFMMAVVVLGSIEWKSKTNLTFFDEVHLPSLWTSSYISVKSFLTLRKKILKALLVVLFATHGCVQCTCLLCIFDNSRTDLNFSSGDPEAVMSVAIMNSWKTLKI